MNRPATADLEERRRILAERARALATATPEGPRGSDRKGLIVLVVGGERYAVDLERVVAIQPLAGLAPVPGLPPWWAGLVNVRGSLQPVLDLRAYLDLPARDHDPGVVVLVSGSGIAVALLADDASEVRWLSEEDVGPTLAAGRADARPITRGVTADVVAVLELEVLLSDPKLVVDDEAQ